MASAAAVAYPADAGVVNIKAAPYNAVGNGITDDTAAIQQAIDDWDWIGLVADPNPGVARAAPKTIYFPEGTYRLTGPLDAVGSTIRLLGAGEGKTTLKLDSNLAAYQTGTNYLLWTGHAFADGQENAGYSNYIEHMTLDVGSGNPAAIGCRYSVANNGSIRHVTIRSSDPARAGKYGLMFGSTAGPGWVADVTIDGFDYGIWGEGSLVNNIVFSDVTVQNSTTAALRPGIKSWTFENLTATNVPMVADMSDARSAILIAGGTFTGPGTNAFQVVANAYLWVRGVTATGFTRLVSQAGVNRFVGATSIAEWASVNYRRGNTSTAWTESSPVVSLNLPATRGPEYNNYDFAQWASPQDFGYTSGDVGPALQLAINSGAKVVYLPYAAYTLSTSVTIGASSAVRKIDFLHSTLSGGVGTTITVGATTEPSVILENVSPVGCTFAHNSSAVVVLRNVGNTNSFSRATLTTGASATGQLFLESAGSNVRIEITRPISFWARQLNRERAEMIISGGASARVLGDNIELHVDYVDADAVFTGSTVEVIGGAFDVLNFPDAYPTTGKAAYTVTDSTVSIVLPGSLRGTTTTMGHWVGDTVSGTTVGHVYDTTDYDATTGQTDDRVAIPMYRSP